MGIDYQAIPVNPDWFSVQTVRIVYDDTPARGKQEHTFTHTEYLLLKELVTQLLQREMSERELNTALNLKSGRLELTLIKAQTAGIYVYEHWLKSRGKDGYMMKRGILHYGLMDSEQAQKRIEILAARFAIPA